MSLRSGGNRRLVTGFQAQGLDDVLGCFGSGAVRMHPGSRVLVLPKTSTDTPSASKGPVVISQWAHRSSSSNLSRAAASPAHLPSSMWCTTTIPVFRQRYTHGSLTPRLKSYRPVSLSFTKKLLQLISVYRACGSSPIQVPIEAEQHVVELSPQGCLLSRRVFPHPFFPDGPPFPARSVRYHACRRLML